MMLRSSVIWMLLAALAVGSAAAADEPRKTPAKPPVVLETIDQPEAKTAARDDLSARSPGMRVVTGPYVSVQVNVDALGHNIVGDAANEPSIAVNPVNRANMVIGWRQFNSVTSNFRQGGWAYTLNKGASWTFPGVLTPGTFRSDPVIDVDASGNFYYQSLKSDFTMDVFKSVDGGATWGSPVPSYGGDKNWFVIDRTGGTGNGIQYGIWQRFASCCGFNVLTRSINGGQSFQAPVSVGMWPTFGMLAVGPGGTLYAAGVDGTTTQDFNQFVLARSTSPPSPGTPPVLVGTPINLGGSMDLQDEPNPVGLLGQATVSTDSSNGPTRGNVYVMASVLQGAELDVNFVRSVDGGLTFSAPVRVNDDPGQPPVAGGNAPTSSFNWHWLAAHAVAPNGRIDAIWYDTRDSGFSNLSRLYYAYSWDAGATWSPNVAVSPQFNSLVGWPQQQKMGDYSTLVSDATGTDVAYAATFNGEQDVYYVRLFPDCNGNGISDVTDLAGHVSLDCNLNHVPDECETAPTCIGAGSVPDGAAATTPLTVSKGAGDTIALAWGASCVAADADYAVYEGTLGSFASHAPRACSTGGATSFGLTPAAGPTYYLVVPVHADREGSYGTDSANAERPQGIGACAPRTLRTCGV